MNEWFTSSKLLWLGASVLLVLFQVKDVFSEMAPLVKLTPLHAVFWYFCRSDPHCTGSSVHLLIWQYTYSIYYSSLGLSRTQNCSWMRTPNSCLWRVWFELLSWTLIP